jgi:hypothetical protein
MREKSAIFVQITSVFCEIWILTLVFEENAIFSQKKGKNDRKF